MQNNKKSIKQKVASKTVAPKKIKLSAGALKEVLWDTLQKVKTGTMDVGRADAIATQSREILRTTALQVRVASASKRKIPSEVLNFSGYRAK